jgi:hypothetical protein
MLDQRAGRIAQAGGGQGMQYINYNRDIFLL